jgi:hypothetical protein
MKFRMDENDLKIFADRVVEAHAELKAEHDPKWDQAVWDWKWGLVVARAIARIVE